MNPPYPFNIRSKGQKSTSQGYKVQKHISGDRMAGVSSHYLVNKALWTFKERKYGLNSHYNRIY